MAIEPLLSFQAKPRFGVWPAHIAPIAALPRFAGPTLVIGGARDRYTPPGETAALYAAVHAAKALWLIPTRGHAAVAAADSPAYRTRLRRFLGATIGDP